MSDLFSIAVVAGFIVLLRKWGKYPEPAKNRGKYSSVRPVTSYRPNNRWEDEDDEDDD